MPYYIIESLVAHGLNKFLLINGHRIVNVVWMQLCAQKAQSKLGCIVKIFDPAYMSKDIVKELGFGPVGHAEEIETSHMMARFPDMVHLEKAVDNPIKDTPLYSVDPTYEHDTLCHVPSSLAHAKAAAEKSGGCTGEPSNADAERGKIYHDHLVSNLVKVVEQLQSE